VVVPCFKVAEVKFVSFSGSFAFGELWFWILGADRKPDSIGNARDGVGGSPASYEMFFSTTGERFLCLKLVYSHPSCFPRGKISEKFIERKPTCIAVP